VGTQESSGIKGSMSNVAVISRCLNPVTSAGHTSEDIGASAKLELVDKFCYLGDMLSVMEMLTQLLRQNLNWME